MSDNRITKPVSFNTKKEDDAKILKHIGRRNFSGYVKKLIQADMQKKEAAKKGGQPVKSIDGGIKFKLEDTHIGQQINDNDASS